MTYEVAATRRTGRHNYTNASGGFLAKQATVDVLEGSPRLSPGLRSRGIEVQSEQGTPGETFPSRKVGFLWYARWSAQRASRSSRFPGDVFSQRSREAAAYGHRNREGSLMMQAWCRGCFAPRRRGSLLALGAESSTARQVAGRVGLRLIGPEDPSRSLPERSLSRSRLPGHPPRVREVQASPGGSHGTQ